MSVFSGTAPELDWNTFNKYVLSEYAKNGYATGADNRSLWSGALGLDLGGKYGLQVGDLDPGSFLSKSTGELNDMGLADSRPTGLSLSETPEWLAALQKAQNDPNTLYTINTDRINADGSTSGGLTRSQVQYKRVGDKLVPVNQRDFTNSSDTSDFMKGLGTFAAVAGGGALLQNLGAASGASGATNAALIDSAAGTAGYGASSAGAGGAAAGGAAAAADPITSYLTTGASEGSAVGNAITGAGGASGAVGSGTAASGLQTLGGLFGSGNPLGTLNTARQLGGLLGGVLGGATAGSGGETYNGPMPTISREGWQASVTPQYMSLMGDVTMPKKKGAANSGLWQFLGA